MWLQVATFLLACSAISAIEESPFDIGLGTLSPSYTQTVGKDDKNIIKVNFQQKDDGVSYTITDPQSGTNSYYNFGGAAGAAAPVVMKELQADQFAQTVKAAPPQAAYAPPPQEAYAPPPQAAYAAPPPVQHVNPAPYQNPPPALYAPQPIPYQNLPPAAYAPQPIPYQNPPPTAYAPQPVAYAPQPTPMVIKYSVPPLPVAAPYAGPAPGAYNPQAVPFAPAMFSYPALDGQRFANNVGPVVFGAGPAPAASYQGLPSPDMIVKSFLGQQAPGGYQGPAAFIAHGPQGYAHFSPAGVAQYQIQSVNHGGHTAEDVAAINRQRAV